MKKRASGFVVILVVSVISAAWAGEGEIVDKAAKYFFYRCAGCHTVGGGKLTGPDLLPSTHWADGDLGAAVKRMEKNVGPISPEEVKQLILFMKSPNVSERISEQKKKIEASHRASLPPASFDMGQKLFRGQKTLKNGGVACIACHRVGNEGGSLGPELTLLKDRLSSVAMQSAIENSSYKIMRPIYEHRKITSEEALHLAEYLTHPEKTEKRFAANLRQALYGALAGFVLAFALLFLLNRQRKSSAGNNLLRRKRKGGDS